jgi:hypothetical protein
VGRIHRLLEEENHATRRLPLHVDGPRSEDLNLVQVQAKDAVTATYTPPLQNYDWPLMVGKTWQAQGETETQTGKISTSKKVEVKGYGIVRVPAGEFEAFYLLGTSDNGARVSEVWYSPKVRHHVKLVNYTNEGTANRD